MKKTLSFLLACATLVSLLTFPTTAATSLSAYRTMVNRSVVVDGHPVEPEWLADTRLGTGSFIGALCDLTHLYLALDTPASSASITVNSKTITATLGSAPTVSKGKIAGSHGVYELGIPLYAFGLSQRKLLLLF